MLVKVRLKEEGYTNMEVVISLSKGHECCKDMVTRGVAVIEGLVALVVSEAVDAESGLLHEEDSEDASVNEAT